LVWCSSACGSSPRSPKESAGAAGPTPSTRADGQGRAKEKDGFPPPAEVGKAFVTYLSDPFYDKGPNDKGIGIQLAYSLGRVAARLRCWRALWPCRWAS
jgi:hypothetical protein